MAGEDRGKQRCDEGPGICSVILTMISIILVVATLPFSLLFVVKGREHYSDKQFTGRTSPLNNNFYFLFLISKQLSFKLTTFCCSKLRIKVKQPKNNVINNRNQISEKDNQNTDPCMKVVQVRPNV